MNKRREEKVYNISQKRLEKISKLCSRRVIIVHISYSWDKGKEEVEEGGYSIDAKYFCVLLHILSG